MKKKNVAKLFLCTLTMALFGACGEDSTTEKIVEVATERTAVVADVSELPKCEKDNEGEQAFVKGEPTARICVDGKWFALKDSDASSADVDFACSTKELKDKSGLKIVCNGDSIGLVLNGAQGEKGDDGKGVKGDKGDVGETGKDGAGCSIAEQTDSTVTITCGDKSMVMNLGAGGLSIDTTMLDSEKVAISMDSLAGYSQKGPFLKGSTIYLYELQDGRTLKQTNGNFTSNIMRDDGRYKFNARNLVSQYAMLVVNGHYRNEVTGRNSDNPINLKAITDMTLRKTANVNLLTHLEFERVYYLVTKKKLKVWAAKRQAQAEILREFHIDTTGLKGFSSAEDLDVFGTSEADAALLAISILLQGDRTEAELMALLSEISNGMAESGAWSGSRADSIKAAIGIWVLNNRGNLEKYRNNVKNWGLGDVPEFEKYIEDYVEKTLDVPNCSGKEDGYKQTVQNGASIFYGKTFVCNEGVAGLERKKNKYLNPYINYGTLVDYRDKKVYKTVQIGNQTWMAENLNYADSVAYPGLQEHSFCFYNDPDSCETLGRLYEWSLAMDSAAVFSDDGKGCGYGEGNGEGCFPIPYPTRGLCPEGWHIPWIDDVRILQKAISSDSSLMAIGIGDAGDDYGFSAIPMGYAERKGTYFYRYRDYVYFWESQDCAGLSCAASYSSSKSSAYLMSIQKSGLSFASSESKIRANPVRCVKNTEIEYGQLLDERDGHVYKTVMIGNKRWMAENLNYRYVERTEELDSSSFCLNGNSRECDRYGRLYLWSAAMDSSAVFSDNGKGCGNGVTCSPTYPVRGVCPKGWHFPTADEWEDLLVAHGRSGTALFAKDYSVGDYYTLITNIYGFSLLGGEGFVRDSVAYYNGGSPNGFFCSQERDEQKVRGGYLGYFDKGSDLNFSDIREKYTTSIVRCVKDDE